MIREEEKNPERRSQCPVSCTLELIGDKWSLLIIRDLMFCGKSTYNEFLNSSESISTNILNNRLIKLSEKGLIRHTGINKRKHYALTDMGLDLKPVMEALGIFGAKHFEENKEHGQPKVNPLKNTSFL